MLPEVVVYDVDLTLTLPPGLSAASGLNAVAQVVKALYARDRNPVTSELAEQGIAALARALPAIMQDPEDVEAREDALFGAWACGTCLDTVGMGLHHMLGGTFDLPHTRTHALVPPYACACNAAAAPDAMARIAAALGTGDAASGLHALGRRLGLPISAPNGGRPCVTQTSTRSPPQR